MKNSTEAMSQSPKMVIIEKVKNTAVKNKTINNATKGIVYEIINELGYHTAIYAENIDSRVKCPNLFPCAELSALNKDDIIIYHFSTGSLVMEEMLMNQQCRKLMIYHNITPAHFFLPYDKENI